MKKVLIHILDFIFPPKAEEIALRNISPEKLIEMSPKALVNEFPYIYSLFSYKNPLIRELIWQIKYKKNKHALQCAAFALYKELFNRSSLTNNEVMTLLPIPISTQRRKERGYNQVELLIDEIIKLDLDKKFSKDFETLARIKNIDKQTFKNRNERLTNTEHIFKVIKPVQENQKIILIDDVSTTGSTLKEARSELLLSGYNDVECLTIAH